jgi:hypothetical protein
LRREFFNRISHRQPFIGNDGPSGGSLPTRILSQLTAIHPSRTMLRHNACRSSDTAAPDAHFQDASAVFSDLTIAIGLVNAYNRLTVGFRVPPKAASRVFPA